MKVKVHLVESFDSFVVAAPEKMLPMNKSL